VPQDAFLDIKAIYFTLNGCDVVEKNVYVCVCVCVCVLCVSVL